MKIEYAPGFQKSFDKCFSMNPIYSIPRFFKDSYYDIKYAWQRVYRGFDDRMVFDGKYKFHAMMMQIIPMLLDEKIIWEDIDDKTEDEKTTRQIREEMFDAMKLFQEMNNLDYDEKKETYEEYRTKSNALYTQFIEKSKIFGEFMMTWWD